MPFNFAPTSAKKKPISEQRAITVEKQTQKTVKPAAQTSATGKNRNSTKKLFGKPQPINYTNPIAAKIQQRRLQLLVHAYCYYELDEPRIDDSTWDKWAKELYQLQQEYPDVARRVIYAADFARFDPSTGFDLPFNTPYIQAVVERLRKGDKNGNGV